MGSSHLLRANHLAATLTSISGDLFQLAPYLTLLAAVHVCLSAAVSSAWGVILLSMFKCNHLRVGRRSIYYSYERQF